MARTKTFNPDIALMRAIELFWTQGFEATSMSDLLTHMGISRQSLYDTYGDKRELFLRALTRYSDMIFDQVFSPLNSPDSSLDTIRHLFRNLADFMADQLPRRACLVTNTATELASHDPEVAQIVRGHFARVTDSLENALRHAIERGELTDCTQPRTLAQLLTALLNGLGVVVKSGASRRELHQVINTALSRLL
jgi:TetR/AcrR family transcriptional repressor of nem operon